MEEAEALQWLRTEYNGAEPFTEDGARELWNEYRAKVAALPPRACAPPTCLLDRTQKEEYAEHHFGQKFAKNPTVIRVLKLDDPGKLVIHQLAVVLPQSDRYLTDMQDPKKRARICLGRGLNFEGIHPRARREGDLLLKPVPHAEFMVTECDGVDFKLREGNRHIAVKEFDGRMLLSAGYHRTHISMYRSNPEDIVLPLFAVLESDTVDGFFSDGSKVPFKRDMVRGTCPPLLSDFFDDSLCITLPLRKRRVEMFVDLQSGKAGPMWIDDES